MARRLASLAVCVGMIVVILVAASANVRSRGAVAVAKPGALTARGGAVSIELDVPTLEQLGWSFTTGGPKEEEVGLGEAVTFPLDESPTLRVIPGKGLAGQQISGHAKVRGALLLTGLGERVVIGNFLIGVDSEGVWTVTNTLGEPEDRQVVFRLSTVLTDFSAAQKDLRVVGEISIDPSWADHLGTPEAAHIVIGVMTIDVNLTPPRRGTTERIIPESQIGAIEDKGGMIGPDILIGDLYEVWRSGRVGDITAFAVGTNACNIGDQRASWIAYTNAHPVIAQNMYRLKDDRFEQIGMSWVKHGFYAVSQSLCDPCNDPTDGSQLGVGCSDPYSGYLNGIQGNMSLLSDVNPHTGYFDYPWTAPAPTSLLDKRLQVHDADLDPDLNAGAVYFVQGQYVAADDSLAGNNNNSASYRRVIVTEDGDNFFRVYPTSQTQRGQPAVRAWQDTDASVTETDIQVLGEGLFILAAKATYQDNGFWHYEYALQNLNSERSAGSFLVPIPRGASIQNIGFHDVDYHSGEIYDLTDWDRAAEEGWVTWWTDTYDQNPNANALRFSTTYNFRFDTNVGPAATTVRIGLFKPGQPTEVQGRTAGPSLSMIDCNENEIEDRCDLECGPGCEEPCGLSLDCNDNNVPDECEPDCNENGIADECDLRDCPPDDLSCADCDDNSVPDECQVDCDGDGIPDVCDTYEDTDGDGVPDCFDLCPETTPTDACECPVLGLCCWDFVCLSDYPREVCISQGGVPDCVEMPCREGCLIGDGNGDGDRDVLDVGDFMQCFSGPFGEPGYLTPSVECLFLFDFDDDDDVDLDDYDQFEPIMDGPK